MQSSHKEIIIDGTSYPLIIKTYATSKSIKLRVVDGAILLTKPKHTSQSEAMDFVIHNTNWLLTRLKESKESLESYLQRTGVLYLHEKPYKLILLKDSKASCIINHSKQELLFSYTDNASLLDILISLAKKALPENLKATASRLNISISKISVRSQRSLWGSRSSSGMLSLNWRLILLPQSLQNYVICHELAHIKFMNHSTSFWIYLNTLCPNAKKLDRELNKIAPSIFF
ncbi:MAG: SprT family zinc-dependent metalloprotease [Opitutales bacterium]